MSFPCHSDADSSPATTGPGDPQAVTPLERVMLRQIEAQENQHRRESETAQALIADLFKFGNRCVDVVERTELLRQARLTR